MKLTGKLEFLDPETDISVVAVVRGEGEDAIAAFAAGVRDLTRGRSRLEVARAALHSGDDALSRSFPPKVRNALDAAGDHKHSLLTRLLLDRINGNKSPSGEI